MTLDSHVVPHVYEAINTVTGLFYSCPRCKKGGTHCSHEVEVGSVTASISKTWEEEPTHPDVRFYGPGWSEVNFTLVVPNTTTDDDLGTLEDLLFPAADRSYPSPWGGAVYEWLIEERFPAMLDNMLICT